MFFTKNLNKSLSLFIVVVVLGVVMALSTQSAHGQSLTITPVETDIVTIKIISFEASNVNFSLLAFTAVLQANNTTCNAGGFSSGTSISVSRSGLGSRGFVTISSESQNNQYLCVKATDGTHTLYTVSTQIMGIDTTPIASVQFGVAFEESDSADRVITLGETFQINFTFNEPILAAPQQIFAVISDPQAATALQTRKVQLTNFGPVGGTYPHARIKGTYTPDNTFVNATVTGIEVPSFSIIDRASNFLFNTLTATAPDGNSVVIDTTPISVVSTAVNCASGCTTIGGSTYAGIGDTIEVTTTFSEFYNNTTSTAAEISYGGLAGTRTLVANSNSIVASVVVNNSVSDGGGNIVEVEGFQDGANTMAPYASTELATIITVDTTPPDITLVRITGDGAVASSYVISVADALSGVNSAETKYLVATSSGTPTTLDTGIVIDVAAGSNLYVTATDNAGNTVTADSTDANVVVDGASINSIATSEGGTALTALSNKVYSSNPTPVVSGVGAGGSAVTLYQRPSASTDDNDYVEIGTTTVSSGETTWSITTSRLTDGEYTFAASAMVVGTTTPQVAYTNAVVIDTVAPSISRVVSVSDAFQILELNGVPDDISNFVRITIEVSESVLGADGTTINITGTINGVTLSSCFTVTSEDTQYFCNSNYTNAAFNNIEAPLQATFTLTDIAGNESSAITLSDIMGIRLDRVAPVATVAPTFVRSGADRDVVVSATDYTTIKIFTNGDTGETVIRNSATITILAAELTTEGPYTITRGTAAGQVTIYDDATNVADQPIIYVDDTAPVINSVSEVDVSNRSYPEFDIVVAHSNHTNNLGVAEPLTVSFGSGACSSYRVTSATKLISDIPSGPDAKTYKIVIDKAKRGTHDDCTITLTDEAGNESVAVDIPSFLLKSSGGGGVVGGRGGVYRAPALVISTVVPTVTRQQSVIPSESTSQSARQVVSISLFAGVENNQVFALQQFLNTTNCPVATTGVGSKGSETTYFGQATRKAVICYQKNNNISPASGYLGKETREVINGSVSTRQEPITTTPSPTTPTTKERTKALRSIVDNTLASFTHIEDIEEIRKALYDYITNKLVR